MNQIADKPALKIINSPITLVLLMTIAFCGQLQADNHEDAQTPQVEISVSDDEKVSVITAKEPEQPDTPAISEKEDSGLDLTISLDGEDNEIARKVLKRLTEKGLIDPEDIIDVDPNEFIIDGDKKGFDHSGHDHGPDFDETIIIPILAIILIFGSPLFIVALIGFQNYRKRKLLHDNVNKLIEKGMDIPPEIFDYFEGKQKKPTNHLKKGIMQAAIGIAVIIWLAAVAGGDVATIGLIPLFIGIANIVIYKLDTPKAESTD